MSGYPIQPARVRRPSLRDETLSRERLLDWLQAKVHHRVVHVIAKAGYGKTTLLADFARRTRLRTLWYRLDAEDRSWVAFLSYLVAAGQAQQETFAPATARMLRDLNSGGPSLNAVLDSFVAELEPLGETGALLILDDYHLVDEAPDVRQVMRALLHRAPERISFVFASRRPPGLPIARLRAQGEVAGLHTDDLRFSEDETERLFRDTYGRPLEPDVLTDLSVRTEGWAASLQLVNSAIQARTPAEVRAFVRSLSGAEGDLYDYLAEEVIGTLASDLQQFLMRVAVLQELDPSLIETATDLEAAEVSRLAAEGERCGLLVRGSDGPMSHRGIHPLVRQFLLHRLERGMGPQGVRDLHLKLARAHFDRWTVACHHFAEANEPSEVHRCLEASVHAILGSGPVSKAAYYLRACPVPEWSSKLAIVQSRAEFLADRPDEALRFAELAFELDASPLASQNLTTLHLVAGDLAVAEQVARQADSASDSTTDEILQAARAVLLSAIDGDLAALVVRLTLMSERQREAGLIRYFGISMLNLANAYRAQGDAERCIGAAREAEQALEASASSSELISAKLVHLWADAHLRDAQSALRQVDLPLDSPNPEQRAEVISELGSVHIWYGKASDAAELLEMAPDSGLRDTSTNLVQLARAELALRMGDVALATRLLNSLDEGLSVETAHKAHRLAVNARAALAARWSDAREAVTAAIELSKHQGAWFWWTYTTLASELYGDSESTITLPEPVKRAPAYLSILAEPVVASLSRFGDPDLAIVRSEAADRAERWRPALRDALESGPVKGSWRVADLLDDIGDRTDIARLRRISRSRATDRVDRKLGRRLARRLAPRVFVEDQGRVRLVIDDVTIDGSTVRRKVLGLLCFLLSRPGYSATRDEALEAMWPDLEPGIAGNSLNQTVYFLRRVIEPNYSEDTSAGYVRFEANMIWLDQELVDCRSRRCWEVIRKLDDEPQADLVWQLTSEYLDRFASDFAYEEWAIPYRDALHAAFLQVVETTVTDDVQSGHFERGVALVRAALAIDPAAENLERLLVRLYRLSGAHLAAAEQYAHYASLLRRDYGIEPPPIDAM